MAQTGFREFLNDLDQAGQLKKITKPVDPRQMSALGSQSPTATMFETIEGYPEWRVATGLVSSRERLGHCHGVH